MAIRFDLGGLLAAEGAMLATLALICDGAGFETDDIIIIGLEIELSTGFSIWTGAFGAALPPPIMSRKDPLDASSFILSS